MLKNIFWALTGVMAFMALGLVVPAYGQDPQFSQYYAAPLYLNPAYAGATKHYRITANTRVQWPNLPRAFTTHAIAADMNLAGLNSGIGLMAMTDRAGSGNLQSSTVAAMYAYKIQTRSGWVISPGLSFAYVFRSLDYDRLVFGDQLVGGNPGVPTNDPSLTGLGARPYFDAGAGFLAYNENIWVGVSALHLNRPNNSVDGGESVVPVHYSVHAGARIPVPGGLKANGSRLSSVAPSFVYRRQGPFDQLDVGMHFIYDPVILGLWYRGIPIQSNGTAFGNNDAIALVLGLRLGQFDVGYSYDFTVSNLGPSTGGAHEIALKFEFDVPRSRRPRRREMFVPCPTF